MLVGLYDSLLSPLNREEAEQCKTATPRFSKIYREANCKLFSKLLNITKNWFADLYPGK